jgi:hypothetical protein
MARFNLLAILSLLTCCIYSPAYAQYAQPTAPIEYSQDWEGEQFLLLNDWLAYINVFEGDCETYIYGYEYSALGTGVAVIADGADSKVLNVYNDYDGSAWGLDDVNCLEANVYRQVNVTAGNVGDYTFSYNVEPPELVGDKVNGFVKIFSTSYDLEYAFLQTSDVGEQSISFTIEESMVGKILQFGFTTVSLRSENSGMLYDNLVFGASTETGGGNGAGGGSDYDSGPASTTFDLLINTTNAARRGTPIDKETPATGN